MSTVMALFPRRADATAAIARLKEQGVHEEAIGLLAREEAIQEAVEAGREHIDVDEGGESAAPAGAVAGLAVGELAGLLAGAAIVAIPGIGQGLAAGAILAAGIGGGAVLGSIAGALIGMGAGEEEAHIIAESVEKGDVLVTVDASAPRALEIADILRRAHAANVEIVAGDQS